MRKALFAISALFIASQVFVSCSSDSDVLSQFSKRKYLKKFKSKNVKYEDKIEERGNALAYETSDTKAKTITATTKEHVKVIAESNNTNEIATNRVEFNDKISEELNKVIVSPNWNSYNRDFKYFNMNSVNNEFNANEYSFSSNAASDVVLVILSIFLPPVAVVVYEDSVTGNFWLDLVLTLLFWIPGMIYAFLVCFGNVSI